MIDNSGNVILRIEESGYLWYWHKRKFQNSPLSYLCLQTSVVPSEKGNNYIFSNG